MSQCEQCMCKTCHKYLFCRGLMNICQGCYTNNKIPWLKCALKLQMDMFLSANMAVVSVNGKTKSIHNHLSGAMVITEKHNKYFSVDGDIYSMKYFQQYKQLLWVKYFKENPNIVKFVKHIRVHEDLISGDCEYPISIAIRYLEIGERKLLFECKELIHLMSKVSKLNAG